MKKKLPKLTVKDYEAIFEMQEKDKAEQEIRAIAEIETLERVIDRLIDRIAKKES